MKGGNKFAGRIQSNHICVSNHRHCMGFANIFKKCSIPWFLSVFCLGNNPDEEIDINFRAIVHLTKIFLPVLMKAPEAAIINVSSFLGIVPKKSAPVYCATKAALHAFSKSLRYQMERTSVKVFEILTPLVDTDMTKGREDDMSKISPEVLAKEVLDNVGKDNYEIRPGKSKMVLLFNRVFPSIAENIAKKR